MMSIAGRVRVLLCVACAGVAAFGPGVAAQKAGDPAAAPIPAQIVSAKKIFIANGNGAPVLDVENLAYNEFYAQMQSWGRYQLVSNPSDAELVFEIRPEVISGSAAIRLEIIDVKTRILLWGFTTYVEIANRNSTARKNFDKAVSTLVTESTKLAGAAPSPAK
jgi:hypothetical protein